MTLKEINPDCSLEGLMMELKLLYSGHVIQRVDSLERISMLGKIEGGRRRGCQRMRWVLCHHQLDGHEFEQALGVGDGQGSPLCCIPWGHKESDSTERLN